MCETQYSERNVILKIGNYTAALADNDRRVLVRFLAVLFILFIMLPLLIALNTTTNLADLHLNSYELFKTTSAPVSMSECEESAAQMLAYTLLHDITGLEYFDELGPPT